MKSPLRLQNYDNHLLGPDASLFVDELLEWGEWREEEPQTVMDLGCGKGLGAIRLAKRFPKAQIFAVDAFESPRRNMNRFLLAGLGQRVVPLASDAHELPFAFYMFEAVFCIYSLQIFGNEPDFLDRCLAPFIKKGGKLAVAVPGFATEYISLPKKLQRHPVQELGVEPLSVWRRRFDRSRTMVCRDAFFMHSHEEAWRRWLDSGGPGTKEDRLFWEDAGSTLHSIGFILEKQ